MTDYMDEVGGNHIFQSSKSVRTLVAGWTLTMEGEDCEVCVLRRFNGNTEDVIGKFETAGSAVEVMDFINAREKFNIKVKTKKWIYDLDGRLVLS